MYKSKAGKTFWLEQLNDFDNLMSPEQVKNDEVSFQSEMAQETVRGKRSCCFLQSVLVNVEPFISVDMFQQCT